MNVFLKILALMLLALLPVVLSTSCSKEDDIDEIFMGKTFFISGATIGGKPLQDEVKELYQNLDSYYISFSEGTFTARLDPACTLSGRWSANGKDKTLTLAVDQYDNASASKLSQDLYDIIRRVKVYEGDANILIIKADDQNYLRLRTSKK